MCSSVQCSCTVQELSQTKQAYECRTAELEKVKAESHKRKKIIATQQLVMQNGKEAYNKVIQSNFTVVQHTTVTHCIVYRSLSNNLNTGSERSHTRTVVPECCKDNDESLWEGQNLTPPTIAKPLKRSSPEYA